MLWLAASRVRHASGTLVRVSESGMQAAWRMLQELTRGKLSGQRSSMKQTDHAVHPHSCSTAKRLQHASQVQETIRITLERATSVPAV